MAGEVHRLIALSLGKIALSRQQRGGINLHKNLLVASVLHKARTTYMMDNFQTLIANRKAQAEREAASKMVVEAPIIEVSENFNDAEVEQSDSVDDQVVPSNGVTDYESRVNGEEAPNGDEESDYIKSDSSSRCGKENLSPSDEEMYVPASSCKLDSSEPLTHTVNKRSFSVLDTPVIVTGKQPLLEHNENIDNGNNQLPSCRCAGAKRRRSCLDSSDLVSQAKRARLSEGYDSCESDSESDYDSSSESHDYVNMQTETTQVTSLVDIFSTGFSGLYKETESSSDNSNGHTGGQINVYVSADHPLAGTQFVLKDVSCATQIKDNVAIPTPIALAV